MDIVSLLALVSFFLLLAALCRNYWTDFQKFQLKGGTRASEETVRFWW